MLLPDDSIVRRRPDLHGRPDDVLLPGGARRLVQQDDLPDREPSRAGHLDRVCASGGVGRQGGRRLKAVEPLPWPDDNDRRGIGAGRGSCSSLAPLVLCSLVAPAPAPRSVTPLLSRTKLPSAMVKRAAASGRPGRAGRPDGVLDIRRVVLACRRAGSPSCKPWSGWGCRPETAFRPSSSLPTRSRSADSRPLRAARAGWGGGQLSRCGAPPLLPAQLQDQGRCR